MATITARRTADGIVRYTAVVRYLLSFVFRAFKSSSAAEHHAAQHQLLGLLSTTSPP